jgi:light-regulated signal transduction histidine kinase (bacteriophytochrome)
MVKITWWEGKDYRLLTVQDNGLGMEMNQEEKIFALFKRLHTYV